MLILTITNLYITKLSKKVIKTKIKLL